MSRREGRTEKCKLSATGTRSEVLCLFCNTMTSRIGEVRTFIWGRAAEKEVEEVGRRVGFVRINFKFDETGLTENFLSMNRMSSNLISSNTVSLNCLGVRPYCRLWQTLVNDCSIRTRQPRLTFSLFPLA